jgi:uncharacterized protein (DUF885 family)
LLKAYRSLRIKVEAAVQDMFSHDPKTILEIRPVEEFEQESSTVAFYFLGLPDGSRPAVFYVNTSDVGSRPKYDIEWIFLHEAIPGHHYQMSLANELEELPRVRRFSENSAYIEGWGLYAESLGLELGFYEDPYSYFGALGGEMLRAVRLVVDTGIHAKGWSRKQAIDYMRENFPANEMEIVSEIDRYIVLPGQALSYKIGQLKIRELRERAEKSLGPNFDIREFHAVILGDGALPLSVLEEKVDGWIAEENPMPQT